MPMGGPVPGRDRDSVLNGRAAIGRWPDNGAATDGWPTFSCAGSALDADGAGALACGGLIGTATSSKVLNG